MLGYRRVVAIPALLFVVCCLIGVSLCARLSGAPTGTPRFPQAEVPDQESEAAAKEPQPDRPRLAVLITIDQLRGDYLSRWNELFVRGGFQRLMSEGTWFRNCHYPYAHTVTGPGHASLATGCSPSKHGIIGNEWYDRETAETVYCAGSPRYQRVPPAPLNASSKLDKEHKNAEPAKKNRGQGSPDRLMTPTVADALKEATGGKARVVSLSFKDRSAVLPGGRRPDACYWFDGDGNAITSTYYRDRLHPWVAEFNQARPADRWFGQTWYRLREDLDYVPYSGPDDVTSEGTGFGQGRTFPHPLTGGKPRIGKEFYEALYNSPFGNEVLLELVKRAVLGEQLGRHDVPDLLCVSFSSNDPVGHCWGPDSQEVMDVTLRTDLILKDLLGFLDAQVGKGRYVVVLSADHGVSPLPELSRAQGKDAGRVLPELMKKQAEAFLCRAFGNKNEKDRWIEAAVFPWLYLNRKLIRERGLAQSAVEDALASWLCQQDGILSAYTRTQLLNGLPVEDALGERVRRSFHPERSGDVAVVTKPYYVYLDEFLTGTGHNTGHPFTAHVPLLAYGPGVKGQTRDDAVTPQAAAVILAHLLGIKPPAAAEPPLPEGLMR